MADEQEPEQVRLMRRMVDLAARRTELAKYRTTMAEQRTAMARDRSRMSAQRSEMSAERSYMAAERTLSVWVRTALGLMVFGLAIDRFGLTLLQAPAGGATLSSSSLSELGGTALVAFGVLMTVTTGLRFLAYARSYRVTHTVPRHHGPFLAPLFAALVAFFGVALLILLLALNP